jgi:quercetin dioxygenase-like cupin family protein
MTVKAISHHFSDGVYAKQMYLEKGHIAITHSHNYDHLSILAQGEVDIALNGIKTRFTAPCCIDIKAGIEHSIEALADSVFFCIHATSETDINKVDETLIERK